MDVSKSAQDMFGMAAEALGDAVSGAATAVSGAAVERQPFMRGFVRLCNDGWLQGWHERNGGNLTYRMTDEDVQSCKSFFSNKPGEWVSMGVQADNLCGAYFVTTGAGRYMRNVELDPSYNVGIVEINETGDSWRIIWGLRDGGKPTSEFPSHFMNHSVRMDATDGACRIMYHAHPDSIIALTKVIPLDSRNITRTLWKAMTECIMVFPQGVGVVPCMVPGGTDIALATSELMKTYDTICRTIKGELIPNKKYYLNLAGGNRYMTLSVQHVFEEFDTRVWVTPYDYLTDTTSELVLAKLKDTKITPIMINSVNGQLRAMESTEEIGVKPGDVFHVDVKASNSKGVRHLKDYAIILFEEGEQSNDFVINDLVNGIAVMNSSGEYEFPYYDQINSNQSNFETRRSNIYADNGKERNMRVYKTSEEPSVGVHVVIRFLDKNGNLFDPARYASYSTLNSYIDYGVNRQNTSEGLELDFPLTPWPVATDAYQYLRGPVYQNFSNLDVASLKADNQAGRIPYNAKWPSNDYAGAKGWFVRMRSQMTFYQNGSYVIELKVPYSTAM